MEHVPKPHLVYLAWGFPPAAKSCAYRMLATANSFARHGWDVTVVTLTRDAWLREHGLDESLLPLVEPSIDVVRLPLYREDLDTDIRAYSRLRAQRPKQWLKWHRRGDVRQFPELVFGRWHDELIAATREVHARKPADLVLATAAPYTFFAPALDLYQHHGVPYVLDYRDGWSLDIIGDREAFTGTSRRGRIESDLIAHAEEAWFVNTPIRDWYRQRYEDRAEHLHVVRNGSDVAVGTADIPLRQADAAKGLTFGYLGTVTFTPARTRALCEGWRLARQESELLSRSNLEFRGHIGAGAARGASGHARIISQYAEDQVSYEGPVAKAETAAVYGSWDALVLALVGGRYVTSGKVYDYISTGLPVMSAHETDHAATEILEGYPLWVRNQGLEAEDLAKAYLEAAELAVTATPEQREAARSHADQFERYRQIEPAVQRLSERFGAIKEDPTA
jgi:glycosyltransferase involved in cell wall biosynthesis